MRRFLLYAIGFALNPASTSCRPPCGQLILVRTVYPDGVPGPDFSVGCQCRTGPGMALRRLVDMGITVRSQLSGPTSCSVSDESEGRFASSRS